MDSKHLRQSYREFKQGMVGIHYTQAVYAMIESHHQEAEKNPDKAVFETQRALGLREALNYIDTMAAKSSTERGAQ